MKIGIITYTNYEERVLLNQYFVIEDLFAIVQHDRSYRRFQVVDGQEKVLLSTDYQDTELGAGYIELPRIEKSIEQIGTDYDAFRTPSTKHKYATTWKVNGGICTSKKHAYGYADMLKRRARFSLERYISDSTEV